MKLKRSISALVLLGAMTTAPLAQAHENVLQSLVTKMISTAVEVTTEELKQQATESVLNTSHLIDTDTNQIATKVTVTELTADEVESKQTSKSE